MERAKRSRGETDALIRHLYLERRHSDQEIADALGLHRVTVTRRRLAMGVRPADRPKAAELLGGSA